MNQHRSRDHSRRVGRAAESLSRGDAADPSSRGVRAIPSSRSALRRCALVVVLGVAASCSGVSAPIDAATTDARAVGDAGDAASPPQDVPDATVVADAGDAASPPQDVTSDVTGDATGPVYVVTQGVGVRSPSCAAAAMCAPGAVAADRETTCGTIRANGLTVALPAPVSSDAPIAQDLYESCVGRGAVQGWEGRVQTRVVDPDGAVVTGYLFADNYFELSVNGQLVARDALGFTPFNASVVRFQARYPMTLAVRLVDWEGYLGVGLESRNGAFHVGDGGFIAAFSNGAVTSTAWRCRPLYIAPLDDPQCVVDDGAGNLDASRCPSTDATIRCLGADPTRTCRAVHLPLAADWSAPGFDDRRWPAAFRYDAARVTNDPAYTTFASSLFASAQFIWSHNLDLDNHVVCRVTIPAP